MRRGIMIDRDYLPDNHRTSLPVAKNVFPPREYPALEIASGDYAANNGGPRQLPFARLVARCLSDDFRYANCGPCVVELKIPGAESCAESNGYHRTAGLYTRLSEI